MHRVYFEQASDAENRSKPECSDARQTGRTRVTPSGRRREAARCTRRRSVGSACSESEDRGSGLRADRLPSRIVSRTTRRIVTVVGIGLFGAWLWSGVGAYTRVSCEACVTFGERTLCRTASGSNEEVAAGEAHRNACAILASGVNESFACDRVPPTSLTCRSR